MLCVPFVSINNMLRGGWATFSWVEGRCRNCQPAWTKLCLIIEVDMTACQQSLWWIQADAIKRFGWCHSWFVQRMPEYIRLKKGNWWPAVYRIYTPRESLAWKTYRHHLLEHESMLTIIVETIWEITWITQKKWVQSHRYLILCQKSYVAVHFRHVKCSWWNSHEIIALRRICSAFPSKQWLFGTFRMPSERTLHALENRRMPTKSIWKRKCK